MTSDITDKMYIAGGLELNCPEYQFIKKHKAGITIVAEGSISPDKYVNYALTFTNSKIELMYQLAFDRVPFELSTQRFVEISEQIINCRR
jgi:hypothetical protein|tara:strand:+ start:538 stop:807 length:270 start_codon:yes stop_codon:yes gene_type:complete